eukprot:364496-Chlamydomonas_euryale.AAC.19
MAIPGDGHGAFTIRGDHDQWHKACVAALNAHKPCDCLCTQPRGPLLQLCHIFPTTLQDRVAAAHSCKCMAMKGRSQK